MSDGRKFTDFHPNCQMNAMIKEKYAPNTNNHKYREYLQRNAEFIMKELSVSSECVNCPICEKALEYKPKSI